MGQGPDNSMALRSEVAVSSILKEIQQRNWLLLWVYGYHGKILFISTNGCRWLGSVIPDWLERPPWGPQPKSADGGMVNIVGTRENWKISSSKSPPPKLKRKGIFSVCLGLPIGCMKFLLPKMFIAIFGLTFTPQKSNLFLLNLIGPDKTKLKLWRLTKIEDSMDRWSASPFGPPISVRMGGLWAKLKARCDWEHPWGTHWEPVGTKEEMKKIFLFLPPQKNLKENPWGTNWEPVGTKGK